MSHVPVQTRYRADYEPTEYATESVELTFDLAAEATHVTSVQYLRRRQPLQAGGGGRLVLDGQDLELLSLALDGRVLGDNEYQRSEDQLLLEGLPEAFTLLVETRIYPDQNTALEGLYRSSGMYCTQCEAEGFRKITYYQDRPDVLARFTTHILADAAEYPVLLANGNRIADEDLGDGRHRVSWEDPFPKPSYLFALVAGTLASIEDCFTTMSGRVIRLIIYSEPHNIEQCHYAMGALKRSMAWDEQVYGREYDLELFMIVAVDDFNMGAMENKGLNIFNTSCVLATPDTATDAAHQRVEAVVAHEYFHNWSGNRVTCRDWFQLSLKEGFTVFRDAQFSAAMNGATAKRIEAVNFLRSVQFAEDGGPLAHPVRPESYQEISNFYTVTIYEKGAEVVRMMHTLLGPDGFRAGSDLYFDRHDGEAATVEDFVRAMEDATGSDLSHFRRWYNQPGTPLVKVREHYEAGTLTLAFEQTPRQMPEQPAPQPQHVPVLLGLLDEAGQRVPVKQLRFGGDLPVRDSEDALESILVDLLAFGGHITVSGLQAQPEVSLLRGFSAPVRIEYPRSPKRLARLVRHDVDGFARWDSLQTLLVTALLSPTAEQQAIVVELFAELLQQLDAVSDAEGLSLFANLLCLPGEAYLFEQADVIDVAELVTRRDALLATLASALREQWALVYARFATGEAYAPTPVAMAGRQLKNLALEMLSLAEEGARVQERVLTQLDKADNLTDRSAALRVLCSSDRFDQPLRDRVLKAFHEQWRAEALVINLWFQLQASGAQQDVERVRKLLEHPSYDARNPNKVRSVLGAFAGANARQFHRSDGAGYRFLTEQVVLLDAANPQLAARVVQPLSRWQRYVPTLRDPMKDALANLLDSTSLSRDLREIVTKSLVS